MKYIEQVKSIVLLLLVLLSIALTFTIWTYTPEYDTIEEPATLETPLSEKRSAEEVVKPLKVLFHHSGNLVTGTTGKEEINSILSIVRQWTIEDLRVYDEEATVEEMNSYMHHEKQMLIQYPAPIPFPVYDAFMQFGSQTGIPEASFDRLAVNWQPSGREPVLLFIDTSAKRVYSASVGADLLSSFRERVVTEAFSYPSYITREEFGTLPIYVPEEKVLQPTYTYLPDEMRERWEILFNDPSLAQASGNVANDQFSDGSGAIMRFDSNMKNLSFVQTDAETADPAVPSELLFTTLDYLNEHGGWTDEYRYFAINPLNQYVNYQLFVDGLPVFSSSLTTDIRLWWGSEEVYMYLRPYYKLDNLVPAQSGETELVSGEEVFAALRRVEGLDPQKVKDVMVAYQPEMNEDRLLITLQPTWYYLFENNWVPVTEEILGGGLSGLE